MVKCRGAAKIIAIRAAEIIAVFGKMTNLLVILDLQFLLSMVNIQHSYPCVSIGERVCPWFLSPGSSFLQISPILEKRSIRDNLFSTVGRLREFADKDLRVVITVRLK